MPSFSDDYDIKQIESWANGVGYEVAHWNGVLSNKKRKEQITKRLHTNEELVLEGCDVKSLVKFEDSEIPIILDVGCGMSYKTGQRINGQKTDFRYIDPLADFYNQILDKKKLLFPRINFGMAEYLTGFAEKNSVSLIMINNALDHSFDPVKGIIECLSVLKAGGILYLYHHKNEAEHENYRGFHQYNIYCKDDQLIIRHKDESTNISELLDKYAHTEVIDLNNYVAAVIIKENDFKIEDFYSTEKDKKRLCSQIMYVISKLLDRRTSAAFSRKYFFLKIFFWISAKFPVEFKEKIKILLHW